MNSDDTVPSAATDKGTVVMLERLCAVGNEQACETLERLCERDVPAACRGVKKRGS